MGQDSAASDAAEASGDLSASADPSALELGVL